MSLRINDEAPNFTAETTQGTINFHEWIGDGWAILFSHPKDFTPVCTTELGYMAGLQPEFAKRNCKIIGLSVDPVSSHGKWAVDIEETQGHKVNYPMIGDPSLQVAKLYDMLPAEEGTTSEGRTAANNATVRTVFVIGPDKKIKLMLSYPMSTGRNFDEVLRVLDSIQLTAKHKVATPVNWKQGEDVIIWAPYPTRKRNRNFRMVGKRPDPICGLFPSRSNCGCNPLLAKEGRLSQRRSWGGRSHASSRCERPPRRFAPPLLCKEGISLFGSRSTNQPTLFRQITPPAEAPSCTATD